MMKLKDVVLHLFFAFAGVLFMLQANSLVVQKFTIRIDIDPQIGYDSKKGPPGIKTVDYKINDPDIIIKKNEFNQI